MVKKKQEKPQREVTKRQLSRWQQQQRRQRIIFGLGIFIIVAVLCIIGVGWFTSQYQVLHQTVITVNDASFDMNYYINVLKYYGKDQPPFYMYNLASEVARIIVQNELIRQEALRLGISVSNDEVDEELKSRDPPLSKDYRELVRAEMLVTRLLDEYFEHQVPVFAEQAHLQAMLLGNEEQAQEVRAKLEAGEDFADLAGKYSLDAISKAKKGDLGWRTKDILAEMLDTSIPSDYAFDAEVGALSQPVYDETKTNWVGYWLIKVLERKEDSDEVHLEVMLLGSEEQAQEVRARLEAGEDFADLAGKFSHLEGAKENGGDIGWLAPGMMSSAFDEFAFDSEVELEALSEPIRDDSRQITGGYWLLKVLAKEDNRKIEDEDRSLLKGKALNEWATSFWDDPENKIESFLSDDKIAWAVEKATKELGQ